MGKVNKDNIAVLSVYPFPIGLATTNRILAYSKGLVENGISVNIFIPFPTDSLSERKSLNEDRGYYQGIEYFYTSGRFRSKYKLFRIISLLTRYRRIKGYFSSIIAIVNSNKISHYRCLIVSTDTIISLFIYSILCKIINIKSVFIFDEYPIPIRHKLKNKIPIWKEFMYKLVLKYFSAYISISDELRNYYQSICKKPTFILPVIIDVSRFNDMNIEEFDSVPKYLCYMGNLELSKDNVDNIIKAFSIIENKYPDLEFHIYGAPRLTTKKYLIELINSLHLGKKVLLKGIVQSLDVPRVLKQAKILVSSQPDTKRASGGFPTKLGEYLASGVPTLLTDVGEISKYVTDKKHLFFVKPNDEVSYSEKLEFILENYDYACEVAAKGKKFVIDQYSHIKKCKELGEFIFHLEK